MLVFQLALRAVRWRAGSAAAVFAVALVAVLAATVGPIYLHAVDERVLAGRLGSAGQYRRDVLVSRSGVVGYGHVDWAGQVHDIAGQVARSRFFGAPLTTAELPLSYRSPYPVALAQLAFVAGECAHLHIVAGRCVTGTSVDDAVLSTRTAASERVHVGETLALSAAGNGVPIRLRVVGLYRPVRPLGAFWRPWDYFRSGQVPAGEAAVPTDAAFVTDAAMAARQYAVPETYEAVVPLLRSRVRYDDIGAVLGTLARSDATVRRLTARASSTGVPVASISTLVPGVLHAVQREASLARTLVTVATAQLALLAILVLYSVVANTTATQGPEVALAKLRGRRTASVLLQSVAQSLVLVVLAAPVAALLAWVLVRVLAAHLLGHAVPVAFPPAAYGVAALAALGGVVATVVAARRIVVTPVGALLRRGGDARASRTGLLVADIAALTVAAAGLVELKAGGVLDGGSPNPLAVLAPTLLAVGVAVLVVRLLPFAGRRVAAWTRDSRRLATFLAVRQVLRRPGELRALLLVAVALAIAAFAVTNWTDAAHNRQLRAVNSAGADTVLVVRPESGVADLRTAVDRADPSGESMAVAYSEADALPPLLAVDTARFARVAAWVHGNTTSGLATVLHRLRSARRPAVDLHGSRLRLTVDLTAHPGRHTVRLAVSVVGPDRQVETRSVTGIRPGAGTYPLSLPSACAHTCEVQALALSANTPDDPFAAQHSSLISADVGAAVLSGGTWRPVADFGRADRWRGDGTGEASARADGADLAVSVRQAGGSSPWPALVTTAAPTTLPAVVASGTAAQLVGDQIHDVATVGLDGQSRPVDGVVRSVTLPQVDRQGVMVDYATALAAMTGPPVASTTFQVWLGPSAPSDMVARLARQHVTVVGTIRASTYRTELDDSGSAFADTLFLVAAIAATGLAIGATAAGRAVSTRRRAYELSALEAVGVPARTLRRATAAEQGTVLVIGLVVGLVTGLVGARLALPSTPVFVSTATGPPVVFGLPWPLLALLTGALVVVFVLVSAVTGALVERAATPGQLRGAQA